MRHTVYETLATDEDKAHRKKEKLVLTRDPIEEDIKKGLSLEEMRKRLWEKSNYDRIRFLEGLLSRKAPGLPPGTMDNIDTIRKESYHFFGDECMAASNFASAAESYGKAGEDALAGKAWKLAGDAYMEEARKARGEEAEPPMPESQPETVRVAQAHGQEGRREGSRPGQIALSPPMLEKHGQEGQKGKAGKPEQQQQAERESKVRPGAGKEEAKAEKPGQEGKAEKPKQQEEKGNKEKAGAEKEWLKEGRKKGRTAVSPYEKAAEAYENANQGGMAASAWKKAGDDYLAMASAAGNDSRYLREALRCYAKAKEDRMSGYVGLMTGMPLSDVEKHFSKASMKKDDYVIMARDMLSKQYYHAARFLFERAGENELARMVSEMEQKSIKK
jgi:tetratricopeptide (TPR) repeat protein